MSHIRHGTGLLCLVLFGGIGMSGQPTGPSTARISQDYGRIPLYFEENRGQTDAHTRYVGHSSRVTALVTNDGARLSLDGHVVSMNIVGANPKARLGTENPVEGVSNYFLGSKAITGVPHYARVRANDILPGIDVVYYGNGGEFEYDLVLSPAADPAKLRFRFAGTDKVEIASNGDLLLKADDWELRQRKPKAWQRKGSEQRSVECRYMVTAGGEVALTLGRYDPSSELTIDPILSFSTYLGGIGTDSIAGMSVDSSGVYVTGSTISANFPFTSGARHDGNGLFVTKLNLSGTALIYSTVIGGGTAAGIAIDSGQNAYITGGSGTNFPNDGLQPASGEHTFALKLDSSGRIVYSTVVAGNEAEDGYAIAVDPSGAAYIAGTTYSTGFPATPGAFRTALSGTTDCFVVKFTPVGKVAYATFLGGNDNDRASAIAVDTSGNAYVAGWTVSTDFPATQGAYATTLKGGADAFISVLNPTGTALVSSTLLGGLTSDEATGIARDAVGNVYITGTTDSNSSFPVTPGAFVLSGGGPAAFIAKFNPSLSLLLYSVRVGGFGSNPPAAIAVDQFGAAYVAGSTSTPNFPTTPGALETVVPAVTMFFLQVSPAGDSLPYVTLLGTGGETATSLAIDGSGGVYVAGYSSGSSYPTTAAAFQRTPPKVPHGGQASGVLSKVDMSSPTACLTTLSASSAAISGIGGPFGFSLTRPQGCPWLVTVDTQGVNFTSLAAGVSSGPAIPISGSVPPNPSVNQRVIKVQAEEDTFTITQAGASCRQPVVSPLPLTLDSAGSLQNVNVVLPDTCNWDASSGAPWLTIGNLDLLYGYQMGSRTLTISAPAFSFSQRTTTLTIAKNAFTVTQTGTGACIATAQATLPSPSSSGGTGEIKVTASPSSCTWAAASLAPWIQLAPGAQAGQGNGPVPYIVGANPGSISRSGQVLVADQLITITQAAGPSGVFTSFTPSRFAGGNDHNSDGKLATDAYIGEPLSPLFDPATGNFYFVDAELGEVRVVTPDGKIDTVAGAGTQTGENIPAKTAQLISPSAVTVDSSGSIYIGHSGRVSKVSQGLMATFAGTGVYGFSGDNGPATSAQIKYCGGLLADASNQLYISDQYNNRVRRVTGGIITTFAGGGSDQISDGEPATMAALSGPTGVILDSAGNILFADGNLVRKVSQGIISTLPIQGEALNGPHSLAFDPAGNLFIVEFTGFREVVPGGTISSPAIPPTWFPDNVAADSSGNLYLGDGSTHGFWKLTPVSFCSYSVSMPLMQAAGGGAAALSVSTAAGCNWTAVSDLSWVTVTSGASGTGGGSVNLTVASNPGIASRTGTIAIAGQLIQVTQAGTSVLSILKNHTGTFAQGQQNATYAVTVSNANGAGATSGTVTVTETAPSGLTLVSMSGTGWTCGSGTCTRADALAAGSSYPAITVTVNVAANATSPQVNQASVSGGGSATANVSDSTTLSAAFTGSVDQADCNTIAGWAADRTQLNQSINVEIWEGATLLNTTLASQNRPDVGVYLSDNGNHGFSIPTPQSLKDGLSHTIQIRFGGSTSQLSQSPKTFTCAAAAQYGGSFDLTDCNNLAGWAADRTKLNQSINVDIYDGATLIATVAANQNRPDVGSFLGDNGNHGFSLPTPSSLKDGNPHSITVKFAGTAIVVGNSPRSLSCAAAAQYGGSFDLADCNNLAGWAADSNRLNQSISVDIYDGATLIATVAANQSRPDVGSYLHDNGNHGFSLPTPASLKDGNAHSITVKFAGTAIVVGNSPRSLSCAAAAQYGGSFDLASCNQIAGWAADSNRLNQSINVDFYDGATLIGTVLASQNRPDVGSYLGDNGNHGFNIATPSSLKTGTAHSVGVKFGGTATSLSNSPKSLTCP